jgi:GTPase SAR1 family protein
MLPDNIEYMDNRIVGMIGGTFSGKSTYVAALIRQIELEGALGDVGCTKFSPLNDEVRERYRKDFYEPLFLRKQQLPLTPPKTPGEIIKPLIYVMVFERKRARPRICRVNLILFDTGGEDMADQAKIAQISRYILNAHGLVFLVDPMSIPGIVEHLPFHLRPKETPPESFRNLDPIINILGRQLSIKPGDSLPIPIAITMAKSDLLRFVLASPDANPVFLQRPDYQQGYQAEDSAAVNVEVEAILKRYQGASLLNNRRAFAKARFCAVSATGMAPDGRGQFHAVEPLRCVDPLLYILHELGVIEG